MITLSITFLLSGLLIFGFCIPLSLAKIPMNSVYGMRTPQAFASEEAWYHLNEVGGMIFAMTGFPLILAGGLGFFLPLSLIGPFGIVVTIAVLLSNVVAVWFFLSYSARYKRRQAEAAQATA